MKISVYIINLIKIAMFRVGASLLMCLIASLASVAIEVLALSSLSPLSALALGRAPFENDPWVILLNYLGINVGIRNLLAVFLISMIVRAITQFGARFMAVRLSKRLLIQLSSEAFQGILLGCSLEDIQKKSIGHYVSLAGNEAARASEVIVMLVDIFNLMVLGIAYLIAIYLVSHGTAFGVLVFAIVVLVPLGGVFKKIRNLGEQILVLQKSVYSVFLDSLNGYRSVKSFSAETYVGKIYRGMLEDYQHLQAKSEVMNSLVGLVPALLLLGGCSIFIALSPSTYWRSDTVNVSLVFTLIVFSLRLFPVASQALGLGLRIIGNARSGLDVMEIIAVGKDRTRQGTRVLGQPIRTIELIDVSFSHQAGVPVLNNVSMRFERGKSYALTGLSGSGKSTLVDLILNFFAVDSGEILVDGISNDEYEVANFRAKVILLSQQVTIFNDTVFNNIAFGQNYAMADVIRAAQIAGADEFIQAMPDKYESLLNYQGSNLSGGQRQRVGLARAIVRQPDVLILDECTNGLDAATRNQLVDGVLELFKDRMVIFITHDSWVIDRVDRVTSLTPV